MRVLGKLLLCDIWRQERWSQRLSGKVVQDYAGLSKELCRGFSTDFTSDVNADDEVKPIQIDKGLSNIYCKCIDRQSLGHQERCISVFQYAATLLHAGRRWRMQLTFVSGFAVAWVMLPSTRDVQTHVLLSFVDSPHLTLSYPSLLFLCTRPGVFFTLIAPGQDFL